MQRATEISVDLGKFRKVLGQLVPALLKTALAEAERKARREIENAAVMAEAQLDAEINRLESLAKINPGVREEEIQAAREERSQLNEVLPASRVRLEGARLIVSMDFLALSTR